MWVGHHIFGKNFITVCALILIFGQKLRAMVGIKTIVFKIPANKYFGRGINPCNCGPGDLRKNGASYKSGVNFF